MKNIRARIFEDQDENPFGFSIGDLMAGIMFVFVLLLSSMMLHIKQVSNAYHQVKTHLHIDLEQEFKDDLKTWNAIMDKETLAIRFQEPEVLFDVDDDSLKPEFKKILNDFFPRYIALISKEEYKDHIEEIRIEGHTSSTGSYEYNMKLSQMRTRTALFYCLGLIKNNKELENWTKYRITANGLASSHLIFNDDGTENGNLSRRVEFRIRTDAEEQMRKISGIGNER
ncbi:MAG: OmpA family protein [Elusimicrobiales bacterium]|nr:OmpA family protein [Elusimicrobiales bacterium]